jgi:iron complex outermembrane receptor protein
MKIKYILGLIIFYSTNLFAQNTFKAIIKNEKTKETLANVSLFVVNYQNSSTSDENGFVTIENITNAKQTIVFNLIGYRK